MVNAIVIAVLVLLVGGVVFYLCREKKKGNGCVGCPYCKQCGGKCDSDRTKTQK